MSQNQKTQTALMFGALGVVFGDIGTSPLYALKIVLGLSSTAGVERTTLVHGLVSLLIWTVILVVSVKYLMFIMRADNKGEGGIMALVALINGLRLPRKVTFIAIGLLGVALFYGDSVVTPAISVLSAVEGIGVVSPGLSLWILPVTLAVLVQLFTIQRYGTAAIGKVFGPIMLLWFLTLGLAGLWRVLQHPDILQALSPLAALTFIMANPALAFVSMGAIVLAVTGAEALYADMGHFGRGPIARAWILLVFPCLALCYLGQGALVLHMPAALENPFYMLFPAGLRLPVVFLATAATLIASQAVISGAFSLTRQAIQLGILPRMRVLQTSDKYVGQIYLPFINMLLLVLVALLVITFGSSERLAGAYGMAVSGALAIDSLLFIVVARYVWRRTPAYVALFALVFISLDIIMVAANVPKIVHGGWLPLTIAAAVLVVMHTWITGRRLAERERKRLEPRLKDFVTKFQKADGTLVRLPGQAVYIGHHEGWTPMALRTAVEELHELHDKAVIVYVEISTAAHVAPEERVKFDELGYADGISQVIITYGFHDIPNVPHTLETVRHLSPELDFDPHKAVYFVSLSRIVIGRRHIMAAWRQRLYAFMAANALSTSDYYHLPVESTVEMRTLIKV